MKVLKGNSAFPGLIKGMACLYQGSDVRNIPRYDISFEDIENEKLRVKNAMSDAHKNLEILREESKEEIVDENLQRIFDVHSMMLKDKSLINKIYALISTKKINAEHAVGDVIDEYINIYNKKNDHFKELVHDMIDLKDRILEAFHGHNKGLVCPVKKKLPIVLITEVLTPSMVLHIPKENIAAIITKFGGYTTHAVILARSLKIPIIFGIELENNFQCSDFILVDGFSGEVVINPDEKTNENFNFKLKKYEEKNEVCEIKKDLKVSTSEGQNITLKLNVSTPDELELVKGYYHDGIGLLRTEFLFLDRRIAPNEEEQFRMYKRVLEEVKDGPVSVRLLDIGSDKWPLFFDKVEQVNPDLEIKGARAVEYFYDTYKAQTKALLRAGIYGNLQILFPMVSDINDIETYNNLISEAKRELDAEKKEYSSDFKIGVMIETPAAALMSDVLLKYVDFANIGSNDLLQYTLAASRGNIFVEKRYHVMHQSLIKLIELIVKAGVLNNKEICLCGEIGSYEEFYPILLDLGIKSFSVSASKFSYLKCEIMHMALGDKKGVLDKLYNAKNKDEVEKIIIESNS